MGTADPDILSTNPTRELKRLLLLLLSFTLGLAAARAQVPADVTAVMDRCRAAMTNSTGLEYEMDMKVGFGPLSMKMHFIVANKGNLSRTRHTTKILDLEAVAESGFNGTDTWEIKGSLTDDTIIFTPGDKRKPSEGDLDLTLDKQYRKAKMKHKDGCYEITFSNPIDKDNAARKATVKISDKNYTLREMRTSASGAKLTMTITHIRVGLKDSYFTPDLSKHPNAVVIRK